MYIDRRYKPKRKRSPWPILIALLVVLAPATYYLSTRTRFFENPFNPLVPTATPTRSAVSHLAEAESLYEAGKLGASAEAYGRVVELEPGNDDALRRLAFINIVRGQTRRAVDHARQALAADGSAINLATLAMALDWNGEYDEAIKIALRAVDIDPLSAEAHAALAEVYADRNNWNRALEEAQQAVELNDKDPLVIRNLGYVLAMQGRVDDALDAYDRAAELAPHLGFVHLGAGNVHVAQGNYADAITAYEKAVAANPDIATPYDALGHASALNGDPDKAIATLRKAVEIDATYGPAYAHLGRVYYTKLNYESAIENLTKAIELGVDKEEYYYQLGLAYSYLDDCENGVRWLNRALEVNPESAPAQQGIRRCQSKAGAP
jgi:tetratricopeptide (TPR) repeat protein